MSEREQFWGNSEAKKQRLEIIRDQIQPIIDEAGISREQGKLDVYASNLAIISASGLTPETGNSEVFRFSTVGYINGFQYLPDAGRLFVAVRNIRVPQRLIDARIGFGTRLVTAWEKAWQAQGINTFAALNVNTKDARRFWTKLGYKPGERTSAHMYKKV